jgi:hypothetical protein
MEIKAMRGFKKFRAKFPNYKLERVRKMWADSPDWWKQAFFPE